METNIANLEAKTADRANKFDIVDTKPVDHGHQNRSHASLTRGRAAKTRPTVNDTLSAVKKFTNRVTQIKRSKTPTQFAHNCKPCEPSHKPKLAIESAATPPNCPDNHLDSTQDEKQQQLTAGLRNWRFSG